jgi:outer membrane protein assembly factor BamB
MLSPLTHDDPADIAGFRLLARLGHGGMGTVYLARTTGGRAVALKTMHAGIAADPASRVRFHLETDAARVIGGRHGAVVVAADPLAEMPWLATEYVLGPPLDDAVGLCGPLPEASVRALGAALAGAFAQLHASGIVHRDLKPSNVMITAYGPKVIDFGIARAAGDDRLTRTGTAAGTPAYMSPEQATGQEHSPAGDVFALAGVLTYAATGHGPFGTGQAADLLYRVRYADPDLSGVPAALLPVLERCLSKDPAERPTTTELAGQLHSGDGEFADHLPGPLLADIGRRATEVWQYQPYRMPVPAGHATAETVPAGKSPRLSRRRLLAVGGGAALSLAGGGAGAWAWLNGRGPDPSEPAANQAPSALWRRSIETASPQDMGRPMLVAGAVVIANEAGVTAVEASTGRTLWSTNPILSPWDVATDGEKLYAVDYSLSPDEGLRIVEIGLEDGELLDPVVDTKAFNGKLTRNQLLCVNEGVAWLLTAPVPEKGADPSADTDVARGWRIVSFSLSDGRMRTEQVLEQSPPEAFPWVTGARAVGSRLVLFFRTGAGGVEAVVCDTSSGSIVWRDALPVEADDAARNPIAVDQENLYVASDAVYARRLADGREAWRYGAANVTSYGSPALMDGVVYVVEGVGERALLAVRAKTGGLLWREKDAVRSGHELKVAPTVGDRYVYKHSAAGLRAIDLGTHRSAWLHGDSLDKFSALMSADRLIGCGEDSLAALPLTSAADSSPAS